MIYLESDEVEHVLSGLGSWLWQAASLDHVLVDF